METKRIYNSVRSVFFGTINKLITIICPFITRTVMINVLGVEYLGLSNLFTSILGALNLAELGFSGVIVYFMYDPIANGDYEKVCSLLNLFRKIYLIVGCIIAFAGVVITPFIRLLIKGSYPTDINIYIIYILMLFSTVISYFLFAYKSALLAANQRLDIESNILTVVYFATYLVQILVLLMFKNYYAYIVIIPITTVLINFVRSAVVDRLYPQYKCIGKVSKEDEKLIWKKASATFGFKIDSVVIRSADSMVISAFLGLVTLAIYNNYFFITSSLIAFWDVIQNAIRPSIGNSIITESVEKNHEDMKKLTFVYSWGLGWCCTCLLCLYQHFITIWLGKDFLLPMVTVILIVLYFYFWKMIDAINVYKDAHGFWLQDKYRPLVEAPFNLILNIILVKKIGLNGVLISTILTVVLISYPTVIYVMYKHYFKGSTVKYILRLGIYTLINVLVCCVSYFLCSYIPGVGIMSFVHKLIFCIIIPNILYILIFYKTKEFKAIKKMIFKIIASNKYQLINSNHK